MTINVYWSVLENEWQRAQKPESLQKIFNEKRLHEDNSKMNFNRCPFFQNHLKNMYALRSLYSYSFQFDEDKLTSKNFDGNFFENHVNIRSIDKKCFSFTQKFVFFTDEKELKVDISLLPSLEDNNISNRCISLPGTMDIAKYFRAIDLAFFLKNDFDEFKIEEGEIFSYIRFHTEEKINFLQFYPSELIKEYATSVLNSRNYKEYKFRDIEYFYNNFKIKKNILKEIKKNLIR